MHKDRGEYQAKDVRLSFWSAEPLGTDFLDTAAKFRNGIGSFLPF